MNLPDVPGRRDRKRRQTLDHLAQTAEKLFVAQGFDTVTMEQIAARADVAKGTLYNHFPTKEAVLAHWVHTQLARDLPALMEGVDIEAGFVPIMKHLLEASADWCEQHRAYLLPYLRYRILALSTTSAEPKGDDSQALSAAFEFLILKAQEAGQMRRDLSAGHLATLFHHLYFGALLRWLSKPELTLRDEFACALTLFTDGAVHPGWRADRHQEEA